jgi:hypothetical protein
MTARLFHGKPLSAALAFALLAALWALPAAVAAGCTVLVANPACLVGCAGSVSRAEAPASTASEARP